MLKQLYKKPEVFTFDEYLEQIDTDFTTYENVYGRLLRAIGKPTLVDTSKSSERMRIIFENRVIRIYEAFKEFYGVEDAVEKIVAFIRHAEQGLEESKAIMYLRGPVGTGKSQLAEVLKKLVEVNPIYVLTYQGKMSPLLEHPLGFFDASDADKLKVPENALTTRILSGWAGKRYEEAGGDLSKFSVTKIYPNQLKQLGIAKVETGDSNNQDTSVLVGKIKIRELGNFDQSDPDCYGYTGGLCRANQGLLEHVEALKVPDTKILNPYLTATQEHNYNGTEPGMGAMPFEGMILWHSNESDWVEFKSKKTHEAFFDRIVTIPITYNLRVDEEVKILEKVLKKATPGIINAPKTPDVLSLLAQFSVLTRLDPDNMGSKDLVTKMKVYNGESQKAKNNNALSFYEYRRRAAPTEGYNGFSTREQSKVLSSVLNFDPEELGANPVHLLTVLRQKVEEARLPDAVEKFYNSIIDSHLKDEVLKSLEGDIRAAFVDSYDSYGQNMFDLYIEHAQCVQSEIDYRNPHTGQILDVDMLEKELERLEKPAKILNPREFRQEVVMFCLKYQAQHGGKNPDWKSYEVMKTVIDATVMDKMEDLLPVISEVGPTSKKDDGKKSMFFQRMKEKGYTEKQTKVAVEFYSRNKVAK